VGPGGSTAPVLTTRPRTGRKPSTLPDRTTAQYKMIFLYPSTSLMIKAGLWLELEATIGFIVGLGLASLMGQRTVPVILMFILEIVLTPIISVHRIPYLLNAQRGVVGLATAHLEPGGLPLPLGFGGGGEARAAQGRPTCCRSPPSWRSPWSLPGSWSGLPSVPGG